MLLQLVKRRTANDDEINVGTFPFDFFASWVDQVVQKWDTARLPNDARFIATFPNSFHFLRSDDYASQTRRYAFTHSYRKNDERTYVFSEGASRPIVESIYVAGFDGNGQYHTGLTDQREPTEQRSAIQRPPIEDSARRADLSALRTPRPQATLSAHVDSSRSMPTPYGLVSASQMWSHRMYPLTLTQPNQVIWYSLEPKM
jgi:hypothetical protein